MIDFFLSDDCTIEVYTAEQCDSDVFAYTDESLHVYINKNIQRKKRSWFILSILLHEAVHVWRASLKNSKYEQYLALGECPSLFTADHELFETVLKEEYIAFFISNCLYNGCAHQRAMDDLCSGYYCSPENVKTFTAYPSENEIHRFMQTILPQQFLTIY